MDYAWLAGIISYTITASAIVVILILMSIVTDKLSYARNFGARMQESCKEEYLELESQRYHINVASRDVVKYVKAIINLMVSVLCVVLVAILVITYIDPKNKENLANNIKDWFWHFKNPLLHQIVMGLLLFTIIPLYIAFVSKVHERDKLTRYGSRGAARSKEYIEIFWAMFALSVVFLVAYMWLLRPVPKFIYAASVIIICTLLILYFIANRYLLFKQKVLIDYEITTEKVNRDIAANLNNLKTRLHIADNMRLMMEGDDLKRGLYLDVSTNGMKASYSNHFFKYLRHVDIASDPVNMNKNLSVSTITKEMIWPFRAISYDDASLYALKDNTEGLPFRHNSGLIATLYRSDVPKFVYGDIMPTDLKMKVGGFISFTSNYYVITDGIPSNVFSKKIAEHAIKHIPAEIKDLSVTFTPPASNDTYNTYSIINYCITDTGDNVDLVQRDINNVMCIAAMTLHNKIVTVNDVISRITQRMNETAIPDEYHRLLYYVRARLQKQLNTTVTSTMNTALANLEALDKDMLQSANDFISLNFWISYTAMFIVGYIAFHYMYKVGKDVFILLLCVSVVITFTIISIYLWANGDMKKV